MKVQLGGDGTEPITETHIKRQAARHDCLSSLLGDGDKWIEMVYREEKSILYCTDLSIQGRTKIPWTGHDEPTNQRRTDPIHTYVGR